MPRWTMAHGQRTELEQLFDRARAILANLEMASTAIPDDTAQRRLVAAYRNRTPDQPCPACTVEITAMHADPDDEKEPLVWDRNPPTDNDQTGPAPYPLTVLGPWALVADPNGAPYPEEIQRLCREFFAAGTHYARTHYARTGRTQ